MIAVGVLIPVREFGIVDLSKDVAVANFFTKTVTVLLNNGKGIFPTTTTYPNAPTRPHALATGDVNSDGKVDLVAAGDQGELCVYLGQGNGTFAAALQAPILVNTLDIALADLDGDGILDAVLGRQFSAVSVLFGNGDGTFSDGPNYGTGGADDIHVVIADLNDDGALDVAAAGGSNARVLLNKGGGTFESPKSIPTTVCALTIDVGDPNGDGIVDLVTGGFGVSFMMGNGDGSFSPGTAYAIGAGLFDAIVADLNSDGFDDVVGTIPTFSLVSIAWGTSDRSAPDHPAHDLSLENVSPFRPCDNQCANPISTVPPSSSKPILRPFSVKRSQQMGTIDIGAFEAQSPPVPPVKPPAQRPGVNLATLLATPDLMAIRV